MSEASRQASQYFSGVSMTRVAQPLDVVAGHHQLDRREERADELRLLVADRLPDALRHRDLGALQLQRHERDAVDVQHDVRPLGVLAQHRDFLGHREVVGLGVVPVDQPDRLVLLTDARLDLHAVAQQAVDVPVGLVQVAAATKRGVALELVDRLVDQVVVVAARSQVLRQQLDLDVRVALAVLPVAEVLVAQVDRGTA